VVAVAILILLVELVKFVVLSVVAAVAAVCDVVCVTVCGSVSHHSAGLLVPLVVSIASSSVCMQSVKTHKVRVEAVVGMVIRTVRPFRYLAAI
jgi:hypothetical protein